MAKRQSDLLVITRTRDLANYVFTITHKSPKEYRFSIVSRMQNYVLDAVENPCARWTPSVIGPGKTVSSNRPAPCAADSSLTEGAERVRKKNGE